MKRTVRSLRESERVSAAPRVSFWAVEEMCGRSRLEFCGGGEGEEGEERGREGEERRGGGGRRRDRATEGRSSNAATAVGTGFKLPHNNTPSKVTCVRLEAHIARKQEQDRTTGIKPAGRTLWIQRRGWTQAVPPERARCVTRVWRTRRPMILMVGCRPHPACTGLSVGTRWAPGNPLRPTRNRSRWTCVTVRRAVFGAIACGSPLLLARNSH